MRMFSGILGGSVLFATIIFFGLSGPLRDVAMIGITILWGAIGLSLLGIAFSSDLAEIAGINREHRVGLGVFWLARVVCGLLGCAAGAYCVLAVYVFVKGLTTGLGGFASALWLLGFDAVLAIASGLVAIVLGRFAIAGRISKPASVASATKIR